MKSPSLLVGKISLKELCILALWGALMFASKVAMAALPNIHLIGLFILLGAVFFGWKTLYPIAVYILLEGLFYGFGIWWISYLYAWPLLLVVAMAFRKNESALIWAVLSGVFGLCFGALCAIPYFFIGGPEMAFSYWINGIPYDFFHCAGNFLAVLLLFKPLSAALQRILKDM